MFKKCHWLVINNNILFALPFRNLSFVYFYTPFFSALASILPSEFRPMINAEVLTRVHAPKTFVEEKCTLHIDYVPFLAEVKIKQLQKNCLKVICQVQKWNFRSGRLKALDFSNSWDLIKT